MISAWGGLDCFGNLFELADRYYPSTKTCYSCNNVKDKMPLSVRTYKCDHCGIEIDRDVNASINLGYYVA